MACAASLLLQLAAAELPKTEPQLEGDAWHSHAQRAARGDLIPVGEKFTYNGREWEVTEDMLTGSKLWAYNTVKGGRFEDAVAIPQIHSDCWGTPDYWNLQMHWQTKLAEQLDVKDYKAGHRYVEVFENWQHIAYALGVIARLELMAMPDLPVRLSIVQPRSYHHEGPVRVWNTTVGALIQYALRISAQVALALSGQATAKTGAHCLDCKASHLCTTLQRGAMHTVEYSGLQHAVEMTPEAMGTEARLMYEAMEVLEARLEGLKTQIEFTLRAGKPVPYWGMEPGRSALKWNDNVTVEHIRMLGLSVGQDLLKTTAPITATQAKDRGVDESVLAYYATRVPGGVSLKPISTDRARKVFAK